MIDLGIAGNADEKLALELLKALEDGRVAEGIEELCSDDFVWTNSGLPTIEGKQENLDFIAKGGWGAEVPILQTMTSFSVDMIHIASTTAEDGRAIVFTERVDHHWDAEGRDLMTPHICGVIEIRDGEICAYRDFFDTVCFSQEPTAPDPAHAMPAD